MKMARIGFDYLSGLFSFAILYTAFVKSLFWGKETEIWIYLPKKNMKN